MTTLRKGNLNITFCQENLKSFAGGLFSAESLDGHVSTRDILRIESEATNLSLARDPSSMYKELFLRMWCARAHELSGEYFYAAICYNRTSKVAGGLKLFSHRNTLLELCARCHLQTDKPDRFENTAYAYLKIANCMEGSLLNKLRQVRKAEIGFLCAGVYIPERKTVKKIMEDISLPYLDELMGSLLDKNIGMKTPDQIELFMRQILNAFSSLSAHSELEDSLGNNNMRIAPKIVLSTFLGRHYENGDLPLDAGRAYQNAAINSPHYSGPVTFDLNLRTAVNYLKAGSPAAALVPLRRISNDVVSITPEFSEAFQTRVRAIETDTQNLYK